jgi:hypothetical protein
MKKEHTNKADNVTWNYDKAAECFYNSLLPPLPPPPKKKARTTLPVYVRSMYM